MNKILVLTISTIILFFAYGIFENMTKNDPKSKRVECQEKTVTFESIYSPERISLAKDLLLSDNYIIKSEINYSVFMPSVLKEFYDIKKADSILIKNILKEKIVNTDKKVLIDYYISENDKKDKNKKGSKSNFFAGYLVFEFKIDKKIVYKIQTDYMDEDGSDIEERMKCVIKSFLSIKNKKM